MILILALSTVVTTTPLDTAYLDAHMPVDAVKFLDHGISLDVTTGRLATDQLSDADARDIVAAAITRFYADGRSKGVAVDDTSICSNSLRAEKAAVSCDICIARDGKKYLFRLELEKTPAAAANATLSERTSDESFCPGARLSPWIAQFDDRERTLGLARSNIGSGLFVEVHAGLPRLDLALAKVFDGPGAALFAEGTPEFRAAVARLVAGDVVVDTPQSRSLSVKLVPDVSQAPFIGRIELPTGAQFGEGMCKQSPRYRIKGQRIHIYCETASYPYDVSAAIKSTDAKDAVSIGKWSQS